MTHAPHWRRFALAATLALITAGTLAQQPDDPSDGQAWIRGGDTLLWDARTQTWSTPVAFWLSYAEASDGKFWGRSDRYPPFNAVNEQDTFLVELEQGSCLMYFFHNRWRRAQDVRRWNPAINELEGCPYVFD